MVSKQSMIVDVQMKRKGYSRAIEEEGEGVVGIGPLQKPSLVQRQFLKFPGEKKVSLSCTLEASICQLQ